MRKCSLKGVHVFVTEKPIEKNSVRTGSLAYENARKISRVISMFGKLIFHI